MRAPQAYARLVELKVPAVTTAEAAAALRVSVDAANKTLTRLAEDGLILPIRRGLWALHDPIDPRVLAEYLTAPWPSYVSLHTALYAHGMIEQIPEVIYVASLDRAQTLQTRVGRFAVHHVAPAFFGGFEDVSGVKLATPEKALLDVLYFSGTRARHCAALPEVEIPARFRRREVQRWLDRVPSRRMRTILERRLDDLRSEGVSCSSTRTASKGLASAS
jgi:predicted transcriptional regulator of viral defense system